MPVEAGTISIGTPTMGQSVTTGLLSVSGMTTPGSFEKENGTFQAALPASSVTVRVDGGSPQVATQRAPDWRLWDVTVNVTTPGPHTITATASRGTSIWAASDHVHVAAVAPRMHIDGVEQTQGIQFFDYEFQGSAAGPDNSVPLIAQKATMLRAYVAEVLNPPGSVNVSGELSIGPNTLVPSNGPIRLRDDDDIDRGQADHTLNFLLPPQICVGTMVCTLRVFDPDRPGPRLYEDETTFSVAFAPTPRLRIHGVLVHSTRPGFNVAAPTSTVFTVVLDTTARVGPTHQIDYTGFTVIDFAGDLTAPPNAQSACGPGWAELLTRLRELRSLSGTTDLYIALLPAGTPITNVRGCGGGGVGAGPEGGAFILMHEVGHALGRLHAPCPANVGSPDPAYPSFTNPNTSRPPYPSGTIGEHGFNLGTNSVLSPQGTWDFMSGCSPAWISPYTFVGMRNAALATQPPGPSASAREEAAPASLREAERVSAADPSSQYLHLIVRLREDGHSEVVSAFHVAGPSVAREAGPLSSIACELLAADGRVLESARLSEELLQRHGGPAALYFGSVPWDSTAQALALTRNGERIYERQLEPSAPRVRLGPPEFQGEDDDVVRFDWTVEAADDVVRYLPRYSNDNGETWRAIGPAQSETSCLLDLRTLPGGEHCLFQVLATSGVRTSASQTDPFVVQVKPVVAEILSPADGTELRAPEGVLLHARAFSPDVATPPDEEMLWFSDQDGLVGVGHETHVTLSTGRHELTLRVADGLGGEAEDVVTVHVH